MKANDITAPLRGARDLCEQWMDGPGSFLYEIKDLDLAQKWGRYRGDVSQIINSLDFLLMALRGAGKRLEAEGLVEKSEDQ